MAKVFDDSSSEDFRTLEPPAPPADLIASALHLPVEKISLEHVGRKLRFTGQILEFNIRASLLVLTTPSANRPFPTVVTNVSVPLLSHQNTYSPHGAASPISDQSGDRIYNSMVNREGLRLHKGEWVCIVGWLESSGRSRPLDLLEIPDGYRSPLNAVLEAIFVSPARQPSTNAIYPAG